jgi:hypothetical protein
MIRPIIALAAWMSFAALASASLAPRPDRAHGGLDVAPSPAARTSARTRQPSANTEYVVTDTTEILLDGKLIRYEAVPGTATIERMEVAPDKKVLRIYFRAGK